jgi:hypothetical protein
VFDHTFIVLVSDLFFCKIKVKSKTKVLNLLVDIFATSLPCVILLCKNVNYYHDLLENRTIIAITEGEM